MQVFQGASQEKLQKFSRNGFTFFIDTLFIDMCSTDYMAETKAMENIIKRVQYHAVVVTSTNVDVLNRCWTLHEIAVRFSALKTAHLCVGCMPHQIHSFPSDFRRMRKAVLESLRTKHMTPNYNFALKAQSKFEEDQKYVQKSIIETFGTERQYNRAIGKMIGSFMLQPFRPDLPEYCVLARIGDLDLSHAFR